MLFMRKGGEIETRTLVTLIFCFVLVVIVLLALWRSLS